jgi:hypothetical protein
MRGHTFYVSIDDHVNNVTYPCIVPEVVLEQAREFDEEILQPFFVPDVSETAITSITIADMVDVIDKGYFVQMRSDDDIVEIYLIICEYIDKLSEYNNIPEVQQYLPKVMKFKEMLERPIRILCNTNPKIKKKVGRSSVSSLLKRYSNVTSKRTE